MIIYNNNNFIILPTKFCSRAWVCLISFLSSDKYNYNTYLENSKKRNFIKNNKYMKLNFNK